MDKTCVRLHRRTSTLAMKVLIVEDQEIVREMLAQAVADNRHFVTAATGDGYAAMASCLDDEPDLVLLDLYLPHMDGFKFTTEAKNRFPELKILALSSRSDSATVYKATESGVDGFLNKHEVSVNELMKAIESVKQGYPYFSASVTKQARLLCNPDAFPKILSKREQEILEYLALGLENDEVGQELNLSPHTINNYRQRIREKIGVHTSVSLIGYAIKTGFYRFAP